VNVERVGDARLPCVTLRYRCNTARCPRNVDVIQYGGHHEDERVRVKNNGAPHGTQRTGRLVAESGWTSLKTSSSSPSELMDHVVSLIMATFESISTPRTVSDRWNQYCNLRLFVHLSMATWRALIEHSLVNWPDCRRVIFECVYRHAPPAIV